MLRTLLKAFGIGLAAAWIGFFAAVFIAIISMTIISGLSSTRPDMTLSYRIIGLAAGCTAFVLGFVGSFIYDSRKLNRATSE
jgi:hypothetical protein